MLRLILYVVLIILVLSFFGVSIQKLILSPTTQMNFGFVWQLVQAFWQQVVLFVQQRIASL